MDYREAEDVIDEDVGAEEDYEAVDVADAEADAIEEVSEAQRAEAADLAKLLRMHPEIWIPYEEHVLERLNPSKPDAAAVAVAADASSGSSLIVSLRDMTLLDAKHTTYPFLTNYEKTKVLSFRASQICNGAKPYVLVPEGVSDAFEIAKLELEAKRLPYIIKRPLPDGSFEVWRLADLAVF
jgi:DNA-directed RNA polymerase I, II, and III subunit RPABC2